MSTPLIDRRGVMRTDSLFYERFNSKHEQLDLEPIWTLSEHPRTIHGKTYPSFYQDYMDCIDEYDVATSLLSGTKHWDKLKKCKWFSQGWKGYKSHRGYDQWPADMFARDVSIAKKALYTAAKRGDTGAAKKLADLMKQATAAEKGRPKREDIAKAAAQAASDDSAFADDLKRLNVISIR